MGGKLELPKELDFSSDDGRVEDSDEDSEEWI
jgi:hypothetical protein